MTRENIISERIRSLAAKVLDKPQLDASDYQKLTVYVNATIAKDPWNVKNVLLAADIYQRQIDSSRSPKERTARIVSAVEVLQTALHLGKNIEISKRLAALYAELRKYDLAEQYSDEVLANDKDLAALGIKGDCCVARRDFPVALGYYTEALKYEPANNELLAKKAYCLLQTGKYNEALEAVNASLKYTPTDFAKRIKKEITNLLRKNKIAFEG